MPFEVGKLLLQVQWVPRDEVWNNFVNSMANSSSSRTKRRLQRGAHRESQSEEDEDFDSNGEEDMAPEAQEWRRARRFEEQADYDEEGQTGEDDDEEREEVSQVRQTISHHPPVKYPKARQALCADFLTSVLLQPSSPSDVDAYFRDASTAVPRHRTTVKGRGPRTDASGYLVRRSLRQGDDSGSRPEFVMPVVIRGGVWEMMKAVARGKEGWWGLWKGTFTSFIYDLLAAGMQPVVSAVISPLIPLSLSTLPLPYVPHPRRTLALLVSSHLITHMVLSPLDLIRTRLVVQSTLPRHRKYTGPWDALKKIVREEGGWRAIYGHPHLVVPALLDLTIRPLLSLSSPLLIERWLHLEPNSSPVSYALAELLVTTSGLLVSLPIETVRRRLQLQRRPASSSRVKASLTSSKTSSGVSSADASTSRPSGNTGTMRGLRTCVETRPKPYTGVVEAIYRIVTEETTYHHHHFHGLIPTKRASHERDPSSHPHPHRPRGRSHQRTETEDSNAPDAHPMARSEILAPPQPTYTTLGGVKSLYRGFTMAAGANLIVFLLTVVTGERVSTGSGSGGIGGGGGSGSGGLGFWAEI